MTRVLTVVMYHYVRDLRHSRYPAIKGLATDDFAAQVRYFKKHYHVVGGPEVMAALAEGAPLPPRPLLLTFDDGYLDHFTDVFPVLERERLPGCFFPPGHCMLAHEVLDVNKVHFVLACVPDVGTLVDALCRAMDAQRSRYQLPPVAEYRARLAVPGRVDPPDVLFCKRLLQRELPAAMRRPLLDELFRRYVTADEAAFAHELYMTPAQLEVLHRHGMYLGSHGYHHWWMDTLSPAEQEAEVDRSLAFLAARGANVDRWIMSYPHGGHSASLEAVLRARGCVAGLTTAVGLARLDAHDPLLLPRLDTNDLPKDADAAPGEWTRRAAGA